MKTIPLRQWFLIFNPHWSQLGCYFKDVSFTQQRLWWVQAGAQECALQQWVILSVYDVEVWWSCCAVLSRSVVSNSLHPMDCQAARLLHPWGFFRQEYWSGFPFPSPGDLPNPGIEPRYPALQTYSLPFESPGKPKNTGVGSLSLLQWFFPIQELNQDVLHCRQIFYLLSY